MQVGYITSSVMIVIIFIIVIIVIIAIIIIIIKQKYAARVGDVASATNNLQDFLRRIVNTLRLFIACFLLIFYGFRTIICTSPIN